MIARSADITVHGHPFAEWLNAHRSADFHAPLDAEQFAVVFDACPAAFGGSLSVEQFTALFCIFYNETGGSMRPVAEQGGPRYCFETTMPGGGHKASYNRAPNRLAGDQMVAMGLLSEPGEWNGHVWPGGPPELLEAANECDFYKYRGRGLIQTTWRTTYQRDVDPLLDVLGYACCDDLRTADLDAVFLAEPSVYLGAVRAFFERMGPAWTGVAEQRWAPVGAHVSGSQAYGAGVYARRCAAVYAAVME